MTVAVCPGSFDPVTVGHMDIINRASRIFDKVIVLVMANFNKTSIFSMEERVNLLNCAIENGQSSNIVVDTFNGLLADYSKKVNATAIVKGLRAVSDFEYEFQMALTNQKLNPETETIFLTTSSQNMYLSSSLVKQIAMYDGDISDFVPACILKDVEAGLTRFYLKPQD